MSMEETRGEGNVSSFEGECFLYGNEFLTDRGLRETVTKMESLGCDVGLQPWLLNPMLCLATSAIHRRFQIKKDFIFATPNRERVVPTWCMLAQSRGLLL
ncbi:hypothetical protein L6164_022426 [Bauhinia variegata]|uniref:Uncharacterized protein n=1 Tax=Bauhinia variegata TaxID=167791 RepID=A0ACB9MFL3_BAUVA|nr:hypothetical protein L6164_022426 [Bauhinia variegata]